MRRALALAAVAATAAAAPSWHLVDSNIQTIDTGVAFVSDKRGYTAGAQNGVGPQVRALLGMWGVRPVRVGLSVRFLAMCSSGGIGVAALLPRPQRAQLRCFGFILHLFGMRGTVVAVGGNSSGAALLSRPHVSRCFLVCPLGVCSPGLHLGGFWRDVDPVLQLHLRWVPLAWQSLETAVRCDL
jgi:hypothetical protein